MSTGRIGGGRTVPNAQVARGADAPTRTPEAEAPRTGSTGTTAGTTTADTYGTGSTGAPRDVPRDGAVPAARADASLDRAVQQQRTMTNAGATGTTARASSTSDSSAARMVSDRPVPRAESAADIPGNVMALSASVGEGGTNHPADVRRVQERLHELDLYHGEINGEYTPELGEAISDFQSTHRDDIRRGVADGSDATFRDTEYARGNQRVSHDGRMGPGDPTTRAMAQAWPHRVGGRSMTEPEAYRYYADQVRERGLPFDESATHLVGVRGYQDGMVHGNEGAGTRGARFDDTLVMLGHRPDGTPMVREYSATTDPGAHRGTTGVDSRTFAVLPDQQMTYRMESRTHHTHHGDRPGLQWQARDGVDSPTGRIEEPLARHSGTSDSFGAGGRSMIHSGSAGPSVRGSSFGCAVADGDWYPGMYNDMERSAGEGGTIRYTILDGANLTAAPE